MDSQTGNNCPANPLTIMVADDELFVREFIQTVLSEAGYRTIDACDGGEALDSIKSQDRPIRLFICDILMPGNNGLDLALEFEAHHPGARVLYISGLLHSIAVQTILLQAPQSILVKPFSPEALLERVDWLIGPPVETEP